MVDYKIKKKYVCLYVLLSVEWFSLFLCVCLECVYV